MNNELLLIGLTLVTLLLAITLGDQLSRVYKVKHPCDTLFI